MTSGHDSEGRASFDLEAYVERARQGPCFICGLVSGEGGFEHDVVYEDDEHIAFLSRYPTVPGYTIVAPKEHIEHVVRDLSQDAYLRIMGVWCAGSHWGSKRWSRQSEPTCSRWVVNKGIRTSTGTLRRSRQTRRMRLNSFTR